MDRVEQAPTTGVRAVMGWLRRRGDALPGRATGEAALVLLILIAGAWWGARFERAWHAAGNSAQFYQSYFEPAVMVGCGRGFVTSAPSDPIPGLRDFLETRVDTFDCAAIPAEFSTQPHGLHAWYYLMHAVGLTWRWQGVSWSGLAPLFGLLFGIVLALAYGLFRLGMGRMLSLAGVFALATSTLHLVNLPHLRDYAKAPFVLALILLMAHLVRGEVTRRRVLLLAAASGIVAGVGYGFRTDLLAGLPPLLLTIALFLKGGVRQHVGLRLQALGLCLLLFVLAAWPVVRYVTARGGCQWHVVLLGFSSYFDERLRIIPASYEWGPYSDAYTHTAVGSYFRPGADTDDGPGYCSPEYDQLTARYLGAILTSFPGDIATRAVASMGGVLDSPAWSFVAPLPDLLPPLYYRRADVLAWLSGWAPVMSVLVLLGIAASDLRIGLWALGVLLWFASLPMLQYHDRHFFHLEWMGWAVFGFLAAWCGRRLRVALQRGGTGVGRAPRSHRYRRVGVMALCLLFVAASVAGARVVQDADVRDMVAELERWTAQPVGVAVEPREAGGWAITPAIPGRTPETPDPTFWVEFLRVDLDPAICAASGPVTVRYDSPREDSTRTWDMDPPVRLLLLPVFKSFLRFETGAPGCITAVHRAPRVRALPAWLSVAVPAEPGQLRPVQSYRGPDRVIWLVEGVRFAVTSPTRFAARSLDVVRDLALPPWGRPRVFAKPEDLYVTRPELRRVRYAVDDAAIGYSAATVDYTGPGWRIDASGEEPFTTLLASWPQRVEAGVRLLATGTVESGGLTVGLQKNGRWLDVVNVTRPGRFAVVIEPTAEEPYDVIIANNQRDENTPTRAVLESIAWIEPGSGQRSRSTP